jgi:lipopolysaccharide export system protein LptA
MTRKKEFIWLSFIRYLSIIIFVIVLSLIIYHLFFSEARKRLAAPVSSLPQTRPENLLIEQQIGLKFLEFRGDRGRIEIKAERHRALKEGTYRLEGKVEIHDFGRRPGLEAWITCEEAQYDQDWRQVILSGQVKLKRQGIDFEAEKIIYRREDELLEAQGAVNLKFKRLTGRATHLNYSLKEEKIELSQEVQIRFEPEEKDQAPLFIEGQSFVFERKQHRGRMEGKIRLSQGKNSGEADWAEFLLSADEQYLSQLELGGQVRGQARTESFEASIVALSLKIKPFLNSHRIHALEAEGGSQLGIIRPEERIHFTAEKIRLVFNRWGGLREIDTRVQANWLRENLKSGEGQEARAEMITYFADKGHLEIRSPQTKKASLSQPGSVVTAAEMTLNVDTQDLEALGEVHLMVEPEKKAAEKKAGILSLEKSVFGLGERLLYSFNQKRMILEEKARIWQEDFSLQARKILLAFDSRELEAYGGVRLSLIRKEEKKSVRPQPVLITSSQMKYLPAENRLELDGPCELLSTGYTVKAEKMLIRFKGETSELDRIEAQGQVTVMKDLVAGRAERGFYEWEKDLFILEGKPVLEDPEQGTIRGDKLTFNLAEGRIVVENQGRERSISIIKK